MKILSVFWSSKQSVFTLNILNYHFIDVVTYVFCIINIMKIINIIHCIIIFYYFMSIIKANFNCGILVCERCVKRATSLGVEVEAVHVSLLLRQKSDDSRTLHLRALSTTSTSDASAISLSMSARNNNGEDNLIVKCFQNGGVRLSARAGSSLELLGIDSAVFSALFDAAQPLSVCCAAISDSDSIIAIFR